jgi:Undecaprenyl-phosphate glucose phosphotransferase
MAFVRDASIMPGLPHARAHGPVGVPISLDVVSRLVAAFDLTWIALVGVATGLLYEAVALGARGEATNHLGSGLAAAMLYLAFAHAFQLYRAPNLLRLKWQIGRCILVWLMVFVFLASLAFVLKIGAMFSRGAMLLFVFSGIVFMAVTRLAVARTCAYVISSRVLAPNQIILVGVAEELAANQALRALESYGYSVVGVFSLSITQDQRLAAEAFKDRMREVVRFVRDTSVDEVILAIPWNRPDVIRQVENELRILPIPVKLVPDTTTERLLKRPLFELGPMKAVELQRAPLNATQRYLKRGMDQLLAALGLLLLMPFFAVIMAAIRLESAGPAMFLQMRVGFNGRPFRIYKFRTMCTLDDGPVILQATKNDKRVTRLGGLLRKLSIDEIPQLLNVLRGEMSLVGPRPHALAHDNEYDQLIATYAIRHKMKPGITGWAQVNGLRGETPEILLMKQRVESDIWYTEYWSLWLDIRILLLTIVRVLKSGNAY